MTPTAAIHVAKKQLGLDDDAYRDLLLRVGGQPSSKDMTPVQQNAVLDEMRRLGFRPASGSVRFKGARKGLEGRFVRKLQAMWIAAWNLGVVEDRRDSALIAFVKRQTHIDHIRWLHDKAEADKVIEAIKAWTARVAGVDWSTGKHLPNWMREPGAKIAVAQWQLLAKAGAMPNDIRDFRLLVRDMAKPVDAMEAGDWLPVMNALGERVRKVKGK